MRPVYKQSLRRGPFSNKDPLGRCSLPWGTLRALAPPGREPARMCACASLCGVRQVSPSSYIILGGAAGVASHVGLGGGLAQAHHSSPCADTEERGSELFHTLPSPVFSVHTNHDYFQFTPILFNEAGALVWGKVSVLFNLDNC